MSGVTPDDEVMGPTAVRVAARRTTSPQHVTAGDYGASGSVSVSAQHSLYERSNYQWGSSGSPDDRLFTETPGADSRERLHTNRDVTSACRPNDSDAAGSAHVLLSSLGASQSSG